MIIMMVSVNSFRYPTILCYILSYNATNLYYLEPETTKAKKTNYQNFLFFLYLNVPHFILLFKKIIFFLTFSISDFFARFFIICYNAFQVLELVY